MEAISLSALAKPLEVIGKAFVPLVKQLHAERRAGGDSATVKTTLLDAPLEETLNRLQDIAAHDSWWRELLQRAQTAYVRPEYLEKPTIRAWLGEDGVRKDLKVLARARLVPSQIDEDAIKAYLSERYAAHTGEAATFAAGIIEAVLNILLAGTLARATPGDLLVVGAIQEEHAQTAARLHRIEEKLGSLPADNLVVQVHTEKAQAALDHILRRRSLPLVDARGELAALAARFEGDLLFCTKPVHAQVCVWAARLYAQDRGQLDVARRYRAEALLVDTTADTTVVDAWLEANTGDVDRALARLRDIDSPDARSNTFLILSRRKGAGHALAWLEAHKPVGPSFFTALGWENAATMLAEAGHWEEAGAYLENLSAAMADECPDLPFVDGVIHAGLTLPGWLRRFALTMQVVERQIERLEGAEAAAHHQRALASFEQANRTLTDIGEKSRASGAETWRAWLLLNEPSTRQEGERVVAEAMRDGATAVDYAQLAYTFNIPFDAAPLERHLRVRELAGGLTPSEIAAKLALWRQTRTKAEVVNFLEEERATLSEVATPGGYAFLLVTALAEADQLDRAEEVLRANREAFGEDFDRLLDQLRMRRGEDVSTSFEDRFLQTGADIDLQSLCDVLARGPDIDKLHRYSLELFKRQRNRRNARRVCDALVRGERHQEIVEFLDNADDLLQLDDDLAVLKAWSLFYVGRVVDAQLISDCLREKRDSADDRKLELNIALAAAAWEKFPDILNREWAERDKREPRYLLQLARLAADIDKGRALQLMSEAVSKAAIDPDLLAAASILAYRLGQDEEAIPWVAEAARLSPPDGPVQTRGMRELVDVALAGADRTRGVQEAFSAARIPIHVAASFWRTPLVRLLVSQPRNNEREPDPRRRTVLPIRHGARGLMDLAPVRVVAADITSLLILGDLELLSALERRFDRILLPWSTTEWLLTETYSCRFHQPSRVAGAKKLRELIVANTLRPFTPTSEPPADLVKEVGRELAELLHAAKEADGRVVRPLPVHRLQSFMEEEANLGEYAAVIMSTVQFLAMLQADAVVDQQTAEQAQGMLAAAEHREPLAAGEPGTGPIFIDGLAISYLTGAGLLDSLHRSRRDLRVHPTTVAELENLIRTEGEASSALEVLSRVRIWLRDRIAARQVEILPRARLSEDDAGIETRLVQELLADVGTADAVLIDDRMAGGLWRATDRAGRTVPVIDMLDLLHDFTRAGLLAEARRWHIHHVLRSRGFVCIPLELEELESYLAGAEPDAATGALRERAELRALRENLQRLRSTTILQQPAETPYLDRLRVTGFLAIRKLWADATVPTATAVARTDWIWRSLLTSPLDWAHTIASADGIVPPANGFLNEIAALLTIPIPDLERGRAFRDWFERTVLAPVEIISPDVLDDLAAMIGARIRGWVDEWTANAQPR